MKVDCEFVRHIHFDPGYALLSAQNCFTGIEMFNILDVHRSATLNDVQFYILMKNISDLGRYETEVIFNLLDFDNSGEIDFQEFYLMFCILIASKDQFEKEFIYRHSSSIFKLIDSDASGGIKIEEFAQMGILFNFNMKAIKRIFQEFDVTGDKNLDFIEFRLFTMACIDEARAEECRRKVKAYENYHQRLLKSLELILRKFIRTDCLPVPRNVERATTKIRLPHHPGKTDWTYPFTPSILNQKFRTRREQMREAIILWVRKRPCLIRIFCIGCCDFCCVEHPDDRLPECRIKLKCECKCFVCLKYHYFQLISCCKCCCPCCPCFGTHEHWHKHTLHEGEASDWDEREKRKTNALHSKTWTTDKNLRHSSERKRRCAIL